MNTEETIKETAPMNEHLPIPSKNISTTPALTIVDSKEVCILYHNLVETEAGREEETQIGIRLSIRNISHITVATIILVASFFDADGNVIDVVEHKEAYLEPQTSRGLYLASSVNEVNRVKSYSVQIIRITTAEEEKVQVCGYQIKTTKSGEEEVKGTIKNISNIKTDSALIANFFNSKKEIIGSKVVIFKEIEPNSIRRFHFIFKPLRGDIVRGCTVYIGDIVKDGEIG